jgi:hypothetical protein
VAISGTLSNVQAFINQTLRRVSMHVYGDGSLMDGAWRFLIRFNFLLGGRLNLRFLAHAAVRK